MVESPSEPCSVQSPGLGALGVGEVQWLWAPFWPVLFNSWAHEYSGDIEEKQVLTELIWAGV